MSLQQEVILCAIESANDNKYICEIIFICRYDGSFGQAAYKQKFDSQGLKSDNSLFATTVIPLRLVANSYLTCGTIKHPNLYDFAGSSS